jgi:hypothetical protein
VSHNLFLVLVIWWGYIVPIIWRFQFTAAILLPVTISLFPPKITLKGEIYSYLPSYHLIVSHNLFLVLVIRWGYIIPIFGWFQFAAATLLPVTISLSPPKITLKGEIYSYLPSYHLVVSHNLFLVLIIWWGYILPIIWWFQFAAAILLPVTISLLPS